MGWQIGEIVDDVLWAVFRIGVVVYGCLLVARALFS